MPYMTFTPAEKKRIREVEEMLRKARMTDDSFPNDVALLTMAQEKLGAIISGLLHRAM